MPNRRRITHEMIAKLLEAFRAAPGDINGAARHAEVDYRTAKKAWLVGWPHIEYAREPMKEIIGREQVDARAELAALRQKADDLAATLEGKRQAENKQKAAEDAAASRVAEGQVIRLARGSVTQLLASLTQTGAGAAKAAAQVKATLETLASNPMTLDVAMQCTRAIQALSSSLKSTVESAKQVMEMERLYLGEPTSITQVNHVSDNASVDEVNRRIDGAMRAIERARRLGYVTTPGADGGMVVNVKQLNEGRVIDATLEPTPTGSSVGAGLADPNTSGVH